MAGRPPRKAERRRWREEIVEHLADLPRQFAALESAMSAFGEDFDLGEFKRAYETETDMEAYNRVQAVERALARVQNYVADLAIAAVKLADLEPVKAGEAGDAERAFSALTDANVINGALGRRLKRAQRARSMIEHSYVRVPAGSVHAAANLVHEAARDFAGPYRTWIEDFLRT